MKRLSLLFSLFAILLMLSCQDKFELDLPNENTEPLNEINRISKIYEINYETQKQYVHHFHYDNDKLIEISRYHPDNWNRPETHLRMVFEYIEDTIKCYHLRSGSLQNMRMYWMIVEDGHIKELHKATDFGMQLLESYEYDGNYMMSFRDYSNSDNHEERYYFGEHEYVDNVRNSTKINHRSWENITYTSKDTLIYENDQLATMVRYRYSVYEDVWYFSDSINYVWQDNMLKSLTGKFSFGIDQDILDCPVTSIEYNEYGKIAQMNYQVERDVNNEYQDCVREYHYENGNSNNEMLFSLGIDQKRIYMPYHYRYEDGYYFYSIRNMFF